MSGLDSGGVTRPILAVIVATVVLYFGKDILLPLAMASILAVAFSPITSRLETFVGRFVSAALVVVLAITAIGAIGFFLTVELTSVAVEVAGYSNNIAAKLASLRGSTPAWLQTIEYGVKDVEQRLQKTRPEPTGRAPQMVQAQAAPPAMMEVLEPAWPILAGFGKGLLIIRPVVFPALRSKRLTRSPGKTCSPSPDTGGRTCHRNRHRRRRPLPPAAVVN